MWVNWDSDLTSGVGVFASTSLMVMAINMRRVSVFVLCRKGRRRLLELYKELVMDYWLNTEIGNGFSGSALDDFL